MRVVEVDVERGSWGGKRTDFSKIMFHPYIYA